MTMETTASGPAYLSIQQTAEMMGTTPRTVWNHIKAGAIPAARIGGSGRYYIAVDTVRALMDTTVNSTPGPAQHPAP